MEGCFVDASITMGYKARLIAEYLYYSVPVAQTLSNVRVWWNWYTQQT